jgi:hypothetical protein
VCIDDYRSKAHHYREPIHVLNLFLKDTIEIVTKIIRIDQFAVLDVVVVVVLGMLVWGGVVLGPVISNFFNP